MLETRPNRRANARTTTNPAEHKFDPAAVISLYRGRYNQQECKKACKAWRRRARKQEATVSAETEQRQLHAGRATVGQPHDCLVGVLLAAISKPHCPEGIKSGWWIRTKDLNPNIHGFIVKANNGDQGAVITADRRVV